MRPRPHGHRQGHTYPRWEGPGERTARRVRRVAGGNVPNRHGGPHRPRGGFPAPFVIIPLFFVVSGSAANGLLLLGLIPVLMMLVVGISVYRARAAFPSVPPPQMPYRAAPPPPPRPAWDAARARFDALRIEYAAYECDAMEVLRLPALADVSVPSTGRFVEAFAEAQALDTDARPGDEHARKFVAAVDRAERAWQAARDAAERIRHSSLTPVERGSVERVLKLLTTARDSDSEAERLTAYAIARSELARLERTGVVHLPRTAVAALDEAARGALPG
ncbi:MAG: hypothetical protein OJJ54_00685 [Pseudonocardia sp.]|nr:hypothetical protein [Pseudonocardia sp.]